MQIKETYLRSFIKGLTWRLIGTIDTFVISYIVTGKIDLAISIGLVELFVKLILYFFHERIWLLALRNQGVNKLMTLIKAISWRVTGTIATVIIAYTIIQLSGDGAGLKENLGEASLIGIVELFSKTIFFYFHERMWLKVSWGRSERPIKEA